MASSCEDALQNSHLAHCIRAKIILKTNDNDSVLLWKSGSENQWELPWFVLKENESFQEGIERWSSDQLVFIVRFSV